MGKTSIIQRFLYDTWCPKYRRTIEELHRADFPIGGTSLTLDILDTGGAYEFPAMKTLNIASSNAFILVYSIEDDNSFDEVSSQCPHAILNLYLFIYILNLTTLCIYD